MAPSYETSRFLAYAGSGPTRGESALSALEPKVVHSSGGGSIYRFSVGME